MLQVLPRVSHFPWFSVFSPYSRSYSVHFSLSTFLSVSLHIFGPTVCISHFLCFEYFLPYPSSYSVHFTFFTFFSVSRYISRATVCVSHFPWFSVFLPYSWSYSVHFSFSTFLRVSHDIPGPTVCISRFPRFWAFLTIFQDRTYLVCFSFSMIFSFLAILQVLQCAFNFSWFYRFLPHISRS